VDFPRSEKSFRCRAARTGIRCQVWVVHIGVELGGSRLRLDPEEGMDRSNAQFPEHSANPGLVVNARNPPPKAMNPPKGRILPQLAGT
jgi:hypothetical protein